MTITFTSVGNGAAAPHEMLAEGVLAAHGVEMARLVQCASMDLNGR